MAELRPEWRRLRFDEMVTSAGATRKARGWTVAAAGVEHYVGLEHLDANSPAIRRWGSPEDVGENSDLRPFEAGDVILARRGIEQRKVGFATFAGVASGHALVFRARPGVVLPEFLPYFLLSDAFMGRADQFSAGSLSKTVNLSTLLGLEFALPPLEEQHRIATLLRALGEVADRYIAVVDAAAMARRALGKRLFIIAPEGESATIGDFADVRNGTTPRRKVDAYWGGTIPWLPTGKVNDRRITDADQFITEKALAECSLGGVVPVGSTLVAMIGEGVTRGKVARLEIPACINQNFAAIVPRAGIDGWFLFYYLEAHYESLRRWSQGTNQQALNCSLLRGFPIFVPPPARQSEIVAALGAIDAREALAVARLAAAREQLRLASAETLPGSPP